MFPSGVFCRGFRLSHPVPKPVCHQVTLPLGAWPVGRSWLGARLAEQPSSPLLTPPGAGPQPLCIGPLRGSTMSGSQGGEKAGGPASSSAAWELPSLCTRTGLPSLARQLPGARALDGNTTRGPLLATFALVADSLPSLPQGCARLRSA